MHGPDAVLLYQVRQVLDCDSLFQSMSSRMMSALRQAVREFNASQGAIDENDSPDVLYCTGRLIGRPHEEVVPWVGRPVGSRSEDVWAAVANDPRVASASRPYLEARKQLNIASAALLHKLIHPTEFYELDGPMVSAVHDIVNDWQGTHDELVDRLMTTLLPTTWDRSKVERFIAKLRTG